MQIKVTGTKIHNTTVANNSSLEWKPREVPVVEGKLVLVNCIAGTPRFYGKNKTNLIGLAHHSNGGNINYKYYQPIIISETEKIETGDWYYNQTTKEFGQLIQFTPAHREKSQEYYYEHCNKVLVLPEQFSPKHLQAIVDGKMKDGGKVLVECDGKAIYPNCESYQCNHPLDPVEYTCDDENCANGCKQEEFYQFIKLNSQGHVTLHKVGEKMYTREEVENLTERAYLEGFHDRSPVFNSHIFKKWFEQNIKRGHHIQHSEV